MTLLPVMARELRMQARLPLTYGLRMVSAIIMLTTAIGFRARHAFAPNAGGDLFAWLNVALFCSIWILVPLITADCISREKREGTLGLLFLTPLKAHDVVLAKGMVHGLRALTLWLAVIPVLLAPFMLGGVTWKEAALSLMINFSCLCWALAAGLVGSALGKAWVRSLLVAFMLALLSMLAVVYMLGCVVLTFMMSSPSYWRRSGGTSGFWSFETTAAAGFYASTDMEHSWESVLAILPVSRQPAWLMMVGLVTVVSMVVVLGAVMLAARIMKRGWQEQAPSALRERWTRILCTPCFGVSYLKRWMQHSLEKNPIGWLERRTWSSRVVAWGWFAAMATVSSMTIGVGWRPRDFNSSQQCLVWLLLGSMAASSAGSFRRERETGVLELLLVSPRSEGQIIEGRLFGLWSQFFPGFLTLLIVWMYIASLFNLENATRSFAFYVGTFITLPVIGLYFSLRRNNFMSAFLLTLLGGVMLPLVLQQFLLAISQGRLPWDLSFRYSYTRSGFGPPEGQGSGDFPAILLQIAIAFWAWRRMYWDLVRRNFSFDRSVS